MRPGWLVVSNTRELQEMNITALFDSAKNLKNSSWLLNRAELDLALDGIKKDVFKVYIYRVSHCSLLLRSSIEMLLFNPKSLFM